jgi:P-type Ca2+ transporter type 2C
VSTSYTSHSLPAQHQAWHTYSIENTLAILGTNADKGLTSQEVEQRLTHYGTNEIQETAGRSNWEILIDQFKNIMLLMLIAVAIVSGIMDLVELQNAGAAKAGVPFKDTIAILRRTGLLARKPR